MYPDNSKCTRLIGVTFRTNQVRAQDKVCMTLLTDREKEERNGQGCDSARVSHQEPFSYCKQAQPLNCRQQLGLFNLQANKHLSAVLRSKAMPRVGPCYESYANAALVKRSLQDTSCQMNTYS